MRVDLDHLPHVLAALDTTAAPITPPRPPESRPIREPRTDQIDLTAVELDPSGAPVGSGRPIASGVGASSWSRGSDPQTPPGGSRHALPVGAGRPRHGMRARNGSTNTGEHATLGTGSHRVLGNPPASAPTNGNGWPTGPSEGTAERNRHADETGGQL
jgi:hypothetical protein